MLTSAGVILAGTFLILLSQPVKDLVEISIGVAIGVLIDTFLVRAALVPGLTLALSPMAGWSGRRWMRGLDPIEGAVETNSAQAGGTE